jgi:hypothetical protein
MLYPAGAAPLPLLPALQLLFVLDLACLQKK